MRPLPRLPAAALAALLVVAFAPPAAAIDVTETRFRVLAERALDDPKALAELRTVTSVEGAPVDLDRALAGATGETLEARLQSLAAPSEGRSPVDARDRARAILSGREYHPVSPPRPFQSLLDDVGDFLRRIGGAFPGGPVAFWLTAAALVIALAALLTARSAGRSAGGIRRAREAGVAPLHRDPAELERAADEAEREGDLAAALRLRFRAGLLRLDRAGVLEFRDSLTTGQAARHLRSATFDALAREFERVAYGRHRPDPAELAGAVTGWSQLLREVAAR